MALAFAAFALGFGFAMLLDAYRSATKGFTTFILNARSTLVPETAPDNGALRAKSPEDRRTTQTQVITKNASTAVIMALSLRPYTNQIRTELNRALCIQPFPCQNIERHNKPEVESRDNPELLLPPVTVNRSEREGCLIEPSINSVRVSLRVGQADMLEVRAAVNWSLEGYG